LRCGSFWYAMKNCDPFESGPLFAILPARSPAQLRHPAPAERRGTRGGGEPKHPARVECELLADLIRKRLAIDAFPSLSGA